MSTIKFAACALILREDAHGSTEILAVSRKNDFTKFGLPGGKVDLGETPLEAMKRELWEETGLKAHDVEHVYTRDCMGDDVYTALTFHVKSFTGDIIQRQGEGVIKWVKPSVLLQGPFGEYNKALFNTLKIKED